MVMKKRYWGLYLLSLSLMFMFQGCIQRPLPQLPGEPSPKYWSSEEESENIDISDLDKNMTESGSVIEGGVVQRIPFPTDEYRKIPRVDARGHGVIKGRIYVLNDYGEKVYGRNTRLYLNPKSSYSDQWYEESFLGGNKMSKADNRLFNYLRFTTSDANGNYAFYGVPSGTYYLIGVVTCGQTCGYTQPRNIRLATLVTVNGKETIIKDLSAPAE